MNCLNCNQIVEHTHCPTCGQEAITSRLTMRDIFLDFLKSIYLFESPILRTIGSLFTRPGTFVREYAEGKRQGFSRPVQFILICVTFYFVIIAVFDVQLIDLQGFDEVDDKKAKVILFAKHLQAYLDKIILLSIPLTALYAKLLFSKRQFRYAEHLTMILYAHGAATLVQTLLIVLIAINPNMIHLNHLVKLAIYTAMFMGFYQVSGAHSFLKSLLLIVLNYLSLGLLIIVGAILFLILS